MWVLLLVVFSFGTYFFLACFQMGFYFVTTGWIFEIGLCVNSINQRVGGIVTSHSYCVRTTSKYSTLFVYIRLASNTVELRENWLSFCCLGRAKVSDFSLRTMRYTAFWRLFWLQKVTEPDQVSWECLRLHRSLSTCRCMLGSGIEPAYQHIYSLVCLQTFLHTSYDSFSRLSD